MACLATTLTAWLPWTEVLHPRLWGAASGPRGVDTTAGFTAFAASALGLLLSTLDDRSPAAREAVRPGLLAATFAAAVAMGAEVWAGAQDIREVTAAFTLPFHVAAAGAAVAFVAAVLRHRATRIHEE